MPKKAMRKALLSSLNVRLIENLIKPTVKMEIKEAKTRVFVAMMKKLKAGGKTLVVVDKAEEDIRRASRNLEKFTLKEGRNLNARDVLLHENILIEKEALEKIAERLR
jgi:large subunit ribosomal protein L4